MASSELTPDQKEKVLSWLNEKATNKNCSMCGQNNWTIGPDFVHLPVHTPGQMVLGGSTYPMVFIVCNNCSHTVSFMAVPLGILPPAPDAEDAE